MRNNCSLTESQLLTLLRESDDLKDDSELLDKHVDNRCNFTIGNTDLYQDLKFSSTHIRLLELLPECADLGKSSKPWYEHVNIRCNLSVVEIDKAPPYDALSYTWGNDEPSIAITVNGNEVMVRRNLADALAALRGQSSRLLWNDALCIDQTSDPERSHQVQLMGDIYRHASTVFVWLGRSEGRNEDLSGKALPMLERFGDAQPISRLPRAPPGPDVPREAEFDQWIHDLTASYNMDDENDRKHWSTHWQTQSNWWKRMKQERMWARRRSDRRPNLIAQLETSKALWITLQEELRILQENQTAQNGVVAELQTRMQHYEQAMDKPLSRLLKLFLSRQEQAIPVKNCSKPLSEGPVSLSVEPTEVQRLHHRIIGNLGEFQREIVSRRQLLTENLPRAFKVFQKMIKRPGRWMDINHSERIAFKELEVQCQSWCSLENDQSEALRKMRLEQDKTLLNFTSSWDIGRKRVLHQGRDLGRYEAEQRDRFKDHISQQANALRNMTNEHECQWIKSPVLDLTIDKFLNHEELQVLAYLKDSMRCLHKQILRICMTDILARGLDSLSRQQGKLCYDVRTATNSIPTVEEEREQTRMSLIEAQAFWVWKWEMTRKNEADQWRGQVLQPEADKSFISGMLLGLEIFCNLRYWNRLWIVQEILLAKKLVLCFGDDARTTRDWSLLSKARACVDSIPADWDLGGLIKEKIMKAQQSFPFLLDRLREDRDEGWPLHRLVEITKSTRCTNPRDKVYGLLGLANDCQKGDFVPDIQKSTQEVFLDTIQWYHQKYGSNDSYPSIIQLSKSMQLSFRTYDEPSKRRDDTTQHLTESAPHQINGMQAFPSSQTFCVKGTQHGPIFDLKQLLDDSKLLTLRQHDWIGLVAQVLDVEGTHTSRTNIERELVYLSSINAHFALKHKTFAYATYEGTESGMDLFSPVGSFDTAPTQLNRSEDEQQFFVLGNGRFGVASTCIRENDILCEFGDQQTALILRRTTSRHFALVSRAILSRTIRAPQVPAVTIESGSKDSPTTVLKSPVQMSTTASPGENTTVYVHLDAISLQQLTEPYEISGKHRFREESFIHEADFGWHEFMTFGIDTQAESLDTSVITSKLVTETVLSPAMAAAHRRGTPTPVMIEKALAHAPETTPNFDFKDPLLLEMLKLALSPRQLVSQWPSKNHSLLVSFGQHVHPDRLGKEPVLIK